MLHKLDCSTAISFVLETQRQGRKRAAEAEADARLAEITRHPDAKERTSRKQSIANACQILKTSTDHGERAEAAITLSDAQQGNLYSRPQDPERRVGAYDTEQPAAAPMTRETLLQIIPQGPGKPIQADFSKTAKQGIPCLAKILQITETNSIKGRALDAPGTFQIRAAFISQILEAGITEQDAREIAEAGWFVSAFDAIEIVVGPKNTTKA